MIVTAESTTIDDQWRQRREGPQLWSRTKALLDRLDQLEAEIQRQRKAAVAIANNMRKKRSRHLRACTLVVARRHRLQIVEWSRSDYSRSVWLRKQITRVINEAKAKGEEPMLPKPPSVAFITKILNTVSFFVRT